LSGKRSFKKIKAIKAGPEAVEKYLNDKEEQIRKIAEQENDDNVNVLVRRKGAFLRDQMLVVKRLRMIVSSQT